MQKAEKSEDKSLSQHKLVNNQIMAETADGELKEPSEISLSKD
jgi:hypothetical protein